MATQELTGIAARIGGSPLPAPRFVPAIVSGTKIQIECPPWCTVDHAEDVDLADLSHQSDFIDLEASVVDKPDGMQMFARLGLDPTSKRAYRRQPFLVLDGGQEADDLSLDAADEFADNLEAFADQIRQLARAARAAGGAR